MEAMPGRHGWACVMHSTGNQCKAALMDPQLTFEADAVKAVLHLPHSQAAQSCKRVNESDGSTARKSGSGVTERYK